MSCQPPLLLRHWAITAVGLSTGPLLPSAFTLWGTPVFLLILFLFLLLLSYSFSISVLFCLRIHCRMWFWLTFKFLSLICFAAFQPLSSRPLSLLFELIYHYLFSFLFLSCILSTKFHFSRRFILLFNVHAYTSYTTPMVTQCITLAQHATSTSVNW
jgi:hypothetical protein